MNEIEDLRQNNDVQSNLDFNFMSLFFAIRDLFSKPEKKIDAAGITANMTVLDYGCGPGGYSIAAAQKVGPKGKVYAADIHPLAIKKVRKKAKKKDLDNIKTILTDQNTGLPNDSIDIALIFDMLHDVKEYPALLKEIYRILKPNGYIALDDHHLDHEEIIFRLEKQGPFHLKEKKDSLYLFSK